MKNINNSYFPFILIGIILICMGLLIGLNINKEEKYIESSNATNISSNNKKSTISTDDNLSKVEEDTSQSQVTKEENKKSTNSPENNQNTQVPSNNNNNNNNNNAMSSYTNKNSSNAIEKITYSDNDLVVINSLEETLDRINTADNDKSFATSAKATFINIVDFLFYGGTIKGITFNELTDAGKSQVLKLANKIDAAIESKIPEYKENISKTTSNAFKKASEVIKAGANNLNSFAYDKLGEENYNSIINAKDELVTYTKNAFSFVGDVGSSLFSSAKDKLNSWYQNFKNN